MLNVGLKACALLSGDCGGEAPCLERPASRGPCSAEHSDQIATRHSAGRDAAGDVTLFRGHRRGNVGGLTLGFRGSQTTGNFCTASLHLGPVGLDRSVTFANP